MSNHPTCEVTDLFSFGRDKRRTQLDRLRSEIEHLTADIERVENEIEGAATSEDPSTVYRYVKRLRSSMAQEELTGKKTRLETLVAQAAQLEAELPDLPPTPPPPPRRRPGPRRRAPVAVVVGLGAVAVALGIGGLFASGTLSLDGLLATPSPEPPRLTTLELIPGVATRAASQRGEVFFTREIDINYASGTILLSGDPPPDGSFWVDDGMTLTVRHADNSNATWRRDFNVGCLANTPLTPQDITELFRPGRNVVSISLFDVCGATVGTSGPITLSTRLP